jgi:AcrR family transcriptional regulator
MSSDATPDARRKEEELRAFWSGLDTIWDAETAPPVAPRRGLDFEQIVQAAVAIADAEGLEAVTMRRVASTLGTGAMSLYRHVPDKNTLVLLMIDEALAEAWSGGGMTHSGDWRTDLRALATSSWAVMRAHHWLPEALLTRPPLTPRAVAGLEWSLAIFDAFEIEIGTKMQFVGAVHFTVLSAALNAAIEDRTRTRLQASDEEIMHSATFVMERIAATGRFPRVMEFVADAEHLDETRQMWGAVELVLDGIGTRLP